MKLLVAQGLLLCLFSSKESFALQRIPLHQSRGQTRKWTLSSKTHARTGITDKAAAFSPYGCSASAAWTSALILGLVAPLAAAGETPPAETLPIPFSTLVQEIKNRDVRELTFSPDESQVLLRTLDGRPQAAVVVPSAKAKLIDLLVSSDVPFSGTLESPPKGPGVIESLVGGLFAAISFVFNFVFPLFVLFVIFSSLRVGPGGGGPSGRGPMGPANPFEMFGKSIGTLELEPKTGVDFSSVAGCDEAKFELTEVVDFLKFPKKYDLLGAIAPRGVLIEGPPGTGKTLMARAVAGEAKVPFISATGSEFVEMFVGVGASRVRDIFTKAKANAPCIIFIDEIDAVAKRRGAGAIRGFGGNDEQEQTLNQILSEMDGFGGTTGVVVLAATNRADVLDPAILRPGRFDRRIALELPDRLGREAILKVHSKGRPFDESVILAEVAAKTTGFSGAALANLLNEAAIVAARRDKSSISIKEVDYALDRVTVGLEKKTGMASETRKQLVAYHEAGHAVAGLLTPSYDEITKVTIVPRSGGAGGFTLFTPSDERQDMGMFSRRYLEDQLCVALGGRVAEELAFGDDEITTGASNDLQKVAAVARKMVTQWGFASNKLGATAWELPDGTGLGTPKMASERTQERIDSEVEALVEKAYTTCKSKLTSNRQLLDAMVEALLQNETIDTDDIKRLQESYMTNVPIANEKSELASNKPVDPKVPQEQ